MIFPPRPPHALSGDGARALYDTTKVLPAYQPLLDELKEQPDPYFGDQKIYALWEEIAQDAPQVFFGTGFTEAQAIIGNQLQAILRGEKAVDAGLHDAFRNNDGIPSFFNSKGSGKGPDIQNDVEH